MDISKELRDLHNSVDYLEKKFIKAEIRFLEKKLKDLKGIENTLRNIK